jgi:ketosteroid isomerase-like protein
MATDAKDAIRSGLAAWSRGDLAGTMRNFSPELEFVTSGVYPGLDPVYRGHDGFTRFWHDFREIWEDIAIVVDRIAAGTPDRYAVVARFQAAGRDGIPVERPVGMAFTMREGLITHVQNFGSGADALDAAGVQPGASD